MRAEIDCVAVTDHNSGAWIDKLKLTYEKMKKSKNGGDRLHNFRELILFPGVEISVNGGIHILAVFDPDATTDNINDLLAKVDYQGNKGESNGVTRKSGEEVVRTILESNAIPIPAHVDSEKGLLQAESTTNRPKLDPTTIRQILEIDELLAVEWRNHETQSPVGLEKLVSRKTKVLGSDCHDFDAKNMPGSNFTWIKMANPSLEELRLALTDGNYNSVRLSYEKDFKPFKTPKHFITRITIDFARYMGRPNAEHLSLSPFYNALIGGRGTGKSTVVHALRLAFRRMDELRGLNNNSDSWRQFKRFSEVPKKRGDDGAIDLKTRIEIEMMCDGTEHQLIWSRNDNSLIVNDRDEDGNWHKSNSQIVTNERFPIRLYSQHQIADLADYGRQALLAIIDESAGVNQFKEELQKEKRTYLSQRARLRELEGNLVNLPEIGRIHESLKNKINSLTQAKHAKTEKAFHIAKRQDWEINLILTQIIAISDEIESLAQNISIDDWPKDLFDSDSIQSALNWRARLDELVVNTKKELIKLAELHASKAHLIKKDSWLINWQQWRENTMDNYEKLKTTLAKQDISNQTTLDQLIQKRQETVEELRQLDLMIEEKEQLELNIKSQLETVQELRTKIYQKRERFIKNQLSDNEYIRMKLIKYGFEENHLEISLRKLLELEEDKFNDDIAKLLDVAIRNMYTDYGTQPINGNRDISMEAIKQSILTRDESLGLRFRNYISKKIQKPEFVDHINCWFPEDDLKLMYSRTSDGMNWTSITQSSKGQRSAALLALLLSIGVEPIILDQPEDDLDNKLIYELIVQQIRENKGRKQLIIVTHNPNVVINGDAELVHAFDFRKGQCRVLLSGALQEEAIRKEVCNVMEGGQEALSRRWARLRNRG